jgi:hypothetical protein
VKREDLVKLAREAVAGEHVVGPDGSETKLPAVLDPGNFNPPEWVLEAMQRAYQRGVSVALNARAIAAEERAARLEGAILGWETACEQPIDPELLAEAERALTLAVHVDRDALHLALLATASRSSETGNGGVL